MKKVWIIGIIGALLLSGCVAPVFETVSDVYASEPPSEMQTILLSLPEDAAEAVMEGGTGDRLYLCDGYELRVQTVTTGSLDDALRAVTGFGEDRLTVMKTQNGEFDRYDCVWCTAGEGGEQVGRTAMIDDGSYFYCVSALSDSDIAFELSQVWQEILDSLALG